MFAFVLQERLETTVLVCEHYQIFPICLKKTIFTSVNNQEQNTFGTFYMSFQRVKLNFLHSFQTILSLVHQILVKMEGLAWLTVGWLNVFVLQERLETTVLVCEHYQIVQHKTTKYCQNITDWLGQWNVVKRIGKWWCSYLLRMFFIPDDIDSCTPNPCQNGGTCMIDSGVAKCTCPPGKTGDNCASMWTLSDCATQNYKKYCQKCCHYGLITLMECC